MTYKPIMIMIMFMLINLICICLSLTHQKLDNDLDAKHSTDSTDSTDSTETNAQTKHQPNSDDYAEHTKDWVDFGNMFAYDTNTKTQMKSDANNNKQINNNNECVCNDSIDSIDNERHECNCDPIIKKLHLCENDFKTLNELNKKSSCNQRMVSFVNRAIQKLINKMNVNFKRIESYDTIEHKSVEVFARIYERDLRLVEQFFVEPIVCDRVEQFEDVITDTIDRLVLSDDSNHLFFKSIITKYWVYFTYSLIGVLVIVFIYKFYCMPFYYKCVTFYFTVFVISFIFQWYLLYQTEKAKKHLTMSSAYKDCVNLEYSDNSFSSLLVSYVWSKEDKCSNYFRALMVDPIWEVNPMVAITSTLAIAGFKPIAIFFDQFGNGLSLFYSHFSYMGKIFITPIFIVVLFLFYALYKGYSFKLPFFLGAIERNARDFPIEQNARNHSLTNFALRLALPTPTQHQNRVKPYTKLSIKPNHNNTLKRAKSYDSINRL